MTISQVIGAVKQTASSTTAAATKAAAAKSAVELTASSTSTFTPRTTFSVSDYITRSYYLGHHHAALNQMQKTLSNVGLIIECRDMRVPISSWNPLLERSLATSTSGRARIIVYTKRDLVPSSSSSSSPRSQQKTHHDTDNVLLLSENAKQDTSTVIKTLKEFHSKHQRNAEEVVFLGDSSNPRPITTLLEAIKKVAREADTLTGLRAMVVGMPNAGKSTLLNKLRAKGMNLPKAAKTGAEPGVTRKLGTPVRIVPREMDGNIDPDLVGLGEGVFLVDTPGVFIPYVSSAEDMLKLSLVGCVKDGLISNVTVADYLLYHLNLSRDGAESYKKFCGKPTNDVYEWLGRIAISTGKLARFREPNIEAAADWIIQEWRKGGLSRFLLDVVSKESLGEAVERARDPDANMSLSRAKKKEKEMRKVRNEARRQGSPSSEGA